MVLLLLKSRFEWNLNEAPNDFQLGLLVSNSIHEKNYHKVFLSKSIEELYICFEYQPICFEAVVINA